MSTGGFAATVSMHQRVFQLLLRATYNAGLATPQMVFASPQVSARIFLALPQIRLGGFPDFSGMFFDLEGWGPFTLGSAQRKVKMRMTMRAFAKVDVDSAGLSVKVNTDTLEFADLSIDPYTGGLFTQGELDIIASDPFRAALLQAMRTVFGVINAILQPFPLDFIGGLADDPSLTAQVSYAPETLLVGLDVDNDELATHGNVLLDETRGHEIGIWVAPQALPSALGEARAKLEAAVDSQGAELDALSIVPNEDYVLISGRASKSGGSVNFSVKAIPRLKRPDSVHEWEEQYGGHYVIRDPGVEEIWFEMDDIHVDIQRPWWAVGAEMLAGLLSFGIGALVVESYVSMIRGNIEGGIDNQEMPPDDPAEREKSRRNRAFTIPGVTRPAIQLRVEEFESHHEGLYSGIRIRPDSWWWAELDGTPWVAAEESNTAAPRFALKLPVDVLLNDPELRVSWTVRRRDTNEIILQRDTLADDNLPNSDNLSITVDGSIVDFLAIDALLVEVRLYRAMGAEFDNIYSGHVVMPVSDYVDRSHPFVRWQHQTVVPIVRVESGGSHTLVTEAAVGRRSAIHRTAIPGRCRMLRYYSLDRVLPRDAPEFELEYLDALPFPVEDIAQHRNGLCDYCFFGGPTKTDPLI